jgi:hypothetical protein
MKLDVFVVNVYKLGFFFFPQKCKTKYVGHSNRIKLIVTCTVVYFTIFLSAHICFKAVSGVMHFVFGT